MNTSTSSLSRKNLTPLENLKKKFKFIESAKQISSKKTIKIGDHLYLQTFKNSKEKKNEYTLHVRQFFRKTPLCCT